MHNDEAGVGRAVKESGISREKIWITSKLWPTEYGESKTLEAIDKILEHMQLDLFTSQPAILWVHGVILGKVRALGISNFDANDEAFEKIMIESRVKPAVLQIECHSYAQRLAIRDKVKPYGIHITCWFLLGGAMSNGALFSLSSDK